MSFRLWFRSPRYLLTLFLAIMLVLAASLSWLGWRLLKQDRALESQRIQERLDNAADLIGGSLLHKFSESRDQFTSFLTLSDSDLAARASELSSRVLELRSSSFLQSGARRLINPSTNLRTSRSRQPSVGFLTRRK